MAALLSRTHLESASAGHRPLGPGSPVREGPLLQRLLMRHVLGCGGAFGLVRLPHRLRRLQTRRIPDCYEGGPRRGPAASQMGAHYLATLGVAVPGGSRPPAPVHGHAGGAGRRSPGRHGANIHRVNARDWPRYSPHHITVRHSITVHVVRHHIENWVRSLRTALLSTPKLKHYCPHY